MPTFVDKTATVELLRGEFASLRELCAPLTPAQWDLASCLPGWTVRDVLSHIVGTESMLAGEPAPEVDLSGLDHLRNAIAESNELWVQSMRSLPGVDVLARFDEITGRRLESLDAMSQDDFDAPSWTPAGRDETYGRFMRIRHYDCYLHECDIRDAIGAPSREDVDDLVSALDEVSTGIGYIVGRKASMPEGARVRIGLTGPAARTYLVQVEGRAAVVESLDRPATVEVELPVPLFLRLTGGRRDLHPAPGQAVHYAGDQALGRQLVEHLAFTI